MVLLAGLLLELIVIFGIVLFILFILFLFISSQEEKPKNPSPSGTIIIPVKSIETPKLSWEASEENGVDEGGSIALPSTDVEEINLWITEKDHVVTAKLASVRMRSEHHEKIVLIENVNKEDIYTVLIPPGTKDIKLNIKEKDHKITVELESDNTNN